MQKGKFKKFIIKNQTLRRFTNRGRGFTPVKAKHNFPTSTYPDNRDYFNDSSRLYDIGEHTFLFDQYSFKNPEELVQLSASLPANNIAIFKRKGALYTYFYPFRNQKDYPRQSQNTESSYKESEVYLPGLYYCNRQWFYTDIHDIVLYSYSIDNSTQPTTHTSMKMDVIPENTPSVYIPFTSIRTPILQAYLPLCTCPIFSCSASGSVVVDMIPKSIPVDVSFEKCHWMGKSILFKDITLLPNELHPNDYSFKVDDFYQTQYAFTKAFNYLETLPVGSHDVVVYFLILVYNDSSITHTPIIVEESRQNPQIDTVLRAHVYTGADLSGSTLSYDVADTNISNGVKPEYKNLNGVADASLYLVQSNGPLLGNKTFTCIYLGEYDDDDENMLRYSYKGFNKETREDIKRLAVPVNEFFTNTSSL